MGNEARRNGDIPATMEQNSATNRRVVTNDLFRGPSGSGQQQYNSRAATGNGEILFSNSFANVSGTNDSMFNDNQQSGQALTAICNPLGCDIPFAIHDKIIKGDFVEFSSLLDSNTNSFNTPQKV